MGVFDQGTFAYLTRSPTGETDGSQWPRYELGVCAYGPGSGELANRVADRIRAWEHDRQSMTELWIEVHPADAADVPTGQVAIRKRHTQVIVRTASSPMISAEVVVSSWARGAAWTGSPV